MSHISTLYYKQKIFELGEHECQKSFVREFRQFCTLLFIILCYNVIDAARGNLIRQIYTQSWNKLANDRLLLSI